MIATHVSALDRTIHETNGWLSGIQAGLQREDRQHAYRALRATLHVLRDRLPVAEAAQLSAQLPALIRGIYWEGWRPNGPPGRLRTRAGFLDAIAAEMCDDTIAPEAAVRTVFAELAKHVSQGEIADVRNALPQPIRALWA